MADKIAFVVDAKEPVLIKYGNGREYPAIFDMRAMAYVEKATGVGHIAFAMKLASGYDSATGQVAVNYTLDEIAALAVGMHRSAGVEITEEQFLSALALDNYLEVIAQIIGAMMDKLPEPEEEAKNAGA